MDVSTNGHNRKHFEDDVVPSGWRFTVPRMLGMLAFLAMVVFWIWVFANRDSIAHPDQFDDPVFVQAAEDVCSARQARIADFPIATAAADPVERSVLVELGTRELELMVGELEAIAAPTDPKGADGVSRWLSDYRLYISDRDEWTTQLAAGEDEPFLLSANEQGGRVSDLLRTFSEVNEMPSCAPSGDA